MLSGLSLLGLHELEARYASYCELANVIRHRFSQPSETLKELYKRLVFNVLIGNTDDHARNHAAFWDGKILELTPAYDLCPQSRIGQEATQAMAIEGSEGNFSTLLNVWSVSEHFQISSIEARVLINDMVEGIQHAWHEVCEAAEMPTQERTRLWGSSILNPFCFRGWTSHD
jgi:serine/threonine-protein kinase HipA